MQYRQPPQRLQQIQTQATLRSPGPQYQGMVSPIRQYQMQMQMQPQQPMQLQNPPIQQLNNIRQKPAQQMNLPSQQTKPFGNSQRDKQPINPIRNFDQNSENDCGAYNNQMLVALIKENQDLKQNIQEKEQVLEQLQGEIEQYENQE